MKMYQDLEISIDEKKFKQVSKLEFGTTISNYGENIFITSLLDNEGTKEYKDFYTGDVIGYIKNDNDYYIVASEPATNPAFMRIPEGNRVFTKPRFYADKITDIKRVSKEQYVDITYYDVKNRPAIDRFPIVKSEDVYVTIKLKSAGNTSTWTNEDIEKWIENKIIE